VYIPRIVVRSGYRIKEARGYNLDGTIWILKQELWALSSAVRAADS
jgi:hypothetical protein